MCGEIKRAEVFSKIKLTKAGVPVRWNICNPCRAKRTENAPAVLAKLARVNLAKSHACVRCGFRGPVECVDLVHVRGVKLYNVSSAYRWVSPAALEAELAKCDPVCACCRRLKPQPTPDSRHP